MVRKILLILVVISFVFGCAAIRDMNKESKFCSETCPESIICQVIPYPETADVLLKLSNLASIDSDLYSAQDAINMIERLETVNQDPSVTYSQLAMFLSEEAGPYVMILSDYVDDFMGIDLVIVECDRTAIAHHFAEQKAIAKIRLMQEQRESSIRIEDPELFTDPVPEEWLIPLA